MKYKFTKSNLPQNSEVRKNLEHIMAQDHKDMSFVFTYYNLKKPEGFYLSSIIPRLISTVINNMKSVCENSDDIQMEFDTGYMGSYIITLKKMKYKIVDNNTLLSVNILINPIPETPETKYSPGESCIIEIINSTKVKELLKQITEIIKKEGIY